MPTISRTALVEHTAQDMYELVCDIDSYPDFLPWCSAAKVSERSETHQLASVTINQVINQSAFVTRNVLLTNQSIQMELVDGPFKHLSGTWQFKSLGDTACKIMLDIDFEFANPMVGRLISPAFNKVCDTLVSAFIKRADQLGKNA